MEASMAWKRVANYNLGTASREAILFLLQPRRRWYRFPDLPDPQEFLALADMFRNEGPINFNTDGNYFVSAAEEVGEQEAHP